MSLEKKSLLVAGLMIVAGLAIYFIYQTKTPIEQGENSAPTNTLDSATTIPSVSIIATDADAAESGTAPTNPSTFSVTRASPAANPLAVKLTFSGTASLDGDYTHSLADISNGPWVVIPANSASQIITITPLDDKTMESDETVTLIIEANETYTLGSPASATITITDSTNPAIQVISPNGGEVACIGEPLVVQWESQGVGEVSISLMRYEPTGGGSGIKIGTKTPVEPRTRGVHEFLWDGKASWLPTLFTITEGSSYAIRLAGSVLKPGAPGVDDLSNEYFTLKQCETEETTMFEDENEFVPPISTD